MFCEESCLLSDKEIIRHAFVKHSVNRGGSDSTIGEELLFLHLYLHCMSLWAPTDQKLKCYEGSCMFFH